MKILMIAPTPFFADRGCHVRIYEQARTLSALGHQVALCTYHNGREIGGLETYRIPNIPWYNKLEAGPSLHKVYLDLLLLGLTWKVARRWRPDVLHGHLHEGTLLAGLTGRLLNIPSVGDLQGSLTGELHAHRFLGGNRLLLAPLRYLERAIDHHPNMLVASCAQVESELRSQFAVAHVLLAPDGVDTGMFRDDIQPDGLASSVPAGRRVVVYLGLLNRYQGVDHLIAAIPQVLQTVPDAHFLIMGYPQVETYRERARQLGIGANVTFTGRLDYRDAPQYLALGDIAVSPKLDSTESNGKLYNYMAMGLPTVAFDTPVNHEILGDDGIYAALGHTGELAKAIVGLLQNPQRAHTLGARLRRRAMEKFSWEQTARQLLAAYETASQLRSERV